MQAGGQARCNFAVIDDGFVLEFDGHVMVIQEIQRIGFGVVASLALASVETKKARIAAGLSVYGAAPGVESFYMFMI